MTAPTTQRDQTRREVAPPGRAIDDQPRAGLSETARAWLLNAPALAVIALIIGFPIGYSFWLSLQRNNLKQPAKRGFIGADNYLSLITDQTFLNSLGITSLFTVVVVVITTVLSLILALVLNETFLGRGVLRSLILLPWAIPGVVGGLMWRWIFDAKVGALNGLLVGLGVIDEYQPFLATSTSAFLVIVAAEVWGMLPFASMILLAGLTAIPSEMYDAARVDRAGALQRFWQVTLPWLLHPLLMVLILQTMGVFRAFDIVYLLTGGGPGESTNVISLQAIRTSLSYTDVGLGSAYAYVIMGITLIISIAYVIALHKRGSFEV
ncbi:carbohydrate ABC transporter permease [Microlunatus parietis]|uniref:Multiple sugar transport system permease protein n=1 Tax=Microlunatus parietis TaxID=682979 RepID=A0A7Y9LCX2_9ACTN|nr:sugar ABC transporter permease [Microlunatus parietis]NYE71371.1 multiple sugar transport system permease protein [Microlunatus parietis]